MPLLGTVDLPQKESPVRGLLGTMALALIAASSAGCHSSPLKDRFDSVSKEISSAKAAGAPRYAPVDYAGAENALSLAKDSETAAISQREDAEGVREQARKDLENLRKLGADEEASLEEAQKRQEGADAHLGQLRRREAELRARGVTDKEIDKALGESIALTQLEASSARAQIKTIKTALELLEVRKQEASARINSATEGIAVAGSQLLHASALCDTAGASARMAEAHSMAKRRAELEVR
jgi:chromosome segregation ATPase